MKRQPLNPWCPLVAILSSVGLALLPAQSTWAVSYKFDMGGDRTPLAPGYERVTPATTLDQHEAYGWTRIPQRVVVRDDPTNPYYSAGEESLEYALYSDGILSSEENTFEFKVEPGRYAVTAAVGDLALGEDRPGNSIWANGVQVVSNETTDGSVKAFTFPVEAVQGKIVLRFMQKQITVMAVTAELLAAGQECKPSVVEYPVQRPGREEYRKNWQSYEGRYVGMWEKARQELKADGIDVETWMAKCADFKQRKDYRSYSVPGLDGRSWSYMDKLAGGIHLDGICKSFSEMGIDGVVGVHAVSAREFPKHGLRYALHSGGERLYGASNITLNLMKNAAGATSTVAGVFSNTDPKAMEACRNYSIKSRGPYADGAAYMMIEEPRGQWFTSGKFGDYSEVNQSAFRKWALEKGWKDLAAKGIPDRGRTLDFYRFYLFRLETAAMFIEACVPNTPWAHMPIMSGNGDVGPEQMNHTGYWPPAFTRRGMINATWTYNCPAAAKMHAETIRIAEEFGGDSIITVPLFVYATNTPRNALTITSAGISALNNGVLAWGFTCTLKGPDQSAWMKTVFLGSRLTHATTGLAHTPPLYVWLPESIVYNDLVDLKPDEGENWKKVWQALFDANLDYTVTSLLKIPRRAVLLYACVRPVLTEEEFGRLKNFIEAGGTVLVTFTRKPEYPDGTPIADWDALPPQRVISVELSAAALAQKAGGLVTRPNWPSETKAVKTYLYQRKKSFPACLFSSGSQAHLLNNTDIEAPAMVKAPGRLLDFFSGMVYEKGDVITIPPGNYALLEEQ